MLMTNPDFSVNIFLHVSEESKVKSSSKTVDYLSFESKK